MMSLVIKVLQTSSQALSSQGAGKRSSTTSTSRKKQKVFTVVAAKATPLSPAMQVEFENQLLCACISAGWSFHSIHDPEVHNNCEVVNIEGSLTAAVKSHYATLQVDGWKDISKKHPVAFMITANH